MYIEILFYKRMQVAYVQCASGFSSDALVNLGIHRGWGIAARSFRDDHLRPSSFDHTAFEHLRQDIESTLDHSGSLNQAAPLLINEKKFLRKLNETLALAQRSTPEWI